MTWQQAIVPLTHDQALDHILAELEDQGQDLHGYPDDAPQRADVEASARALVGLSGIVADLAKTASVETIATLVDDWIDAAMTFFAESRIAATAAVWNVTLICTASAAPITIDGTNAGNIQIQCNGGLILQCVQQAKVQFNLGTLYQGVARFNARTLGVAGNVSPSAVQRVISGPAGLDVLIDISPTLVTSGRDAELSAALIRRCLAKWATLGVGSILMTWDYWIAKWAPSLNRWRVNDANPNGPGTIEITLANSSGPATVQEVADVVAGAAALTFDRSGAGAINVVAAVADPVTVTAVLSVDGSNGSVLTQATSAITALGRAFALGPCTLTFDLLREVLMGARLDTVKVPVPGGSAAVVLNLPGFSSVLEIASLSVVADHVVAANKVLVLTPAIS